MIRENLQQPECTAPHLTHQHSDGQQPDHQNKCWQSSDTDVNVVCSLLSLSSAPVSFQTQKPPGEENIMVQFKTSVWPPETQLWTVRCLLWNIQLFLYLHILELGHWCGCLVYKWKCYVTKDTQATREHIIVATRLDVPPACLVFARHPGNLRWPTGDR